MNEEQYYALHKRDRARAHMQLKQHEYIAASIDLARAQHELNDAIAADPRSWNRPGIVESGH
jgi:hypothetical protein